MYEKMSWPLLRQKAAQDPLLELRCHLHEREFLDEVWLNDSLGGIGIEPTIDGEGWMHMICFRTH